MLFGYPVAATNDNWVHECLSAMVRTTHDCLQAGTALPAWPDIIPAAFQDRLRKRTGLGDKLDAYQKTAVRLSLADRERVAQALTDQNQIALLLSCRSDCAAIDDLPQAIRAPIRDLFEFAFGLLTPLGLRDNHYRAIYADLPDKLCPFCGCEYFDAPGAPREDLDHYLSASRYPFAAANLRNLAPMGPKCNERYKLAADILRRDDGSRRRAFDPYAAPGVRLSLADSRPFEGKDGQAPEWQIEFAPDCEEAQTWDEVFHIRERYRRDVLDPHFITWLRDFGSWCRFTNATPADDQTVITALGTYADYCESLGWSDRAFLKAAVFRMLHRHILQGDQRLLSLISSIMPQPDRQ